MTNKKPKQKPKSKECQKDTKILKLLKKSLEEQQKVEKNYNEKINLIVDTISERHAVLNHRGDEFVYLSHYNKEIETQSRIKNLHIEKWGELYKTQMKYIDKIIKSIKVK